MLSIVFILVLGCRASLNLLAYSILIHQTTIKFIYIWNQNHLGYPALKKNIWKWGKQWKMVKGWSHVRRILSAYRNTLRQDSRGLSCFKTQNCYWMCVCATLRCSKQKWVYFRSYIIVYCCYSVKCLNFPLHVLLEYHDFQVQHVLYSKQLKLSRTLPILPFLNAQS